MSRYAVSIIVRNLDKERGDDTDDCVVRAEIIATSARAAAQLSGEILSEEVIGPELHSVRSELLH